MVRYDGGRVLGTVEVAVGAGTVSVGVGIVASVVAVGVAVTTMMMVRGVGVRVGMMGSSTVDIVDGRVMMNVRSWLNGLVSSPRVSS